MKLMVTWLRKNGNCRTWTNGDEFENVCMGLIGYHEATLRLAKKLNISQEKVKNMDENIGLKHIKQQEG